MARRRPYPKYRGTALRGKDAAEIMRIPARPSRKGEVKRSVVPNREWAGKLKATTKGS